MTVRTDKCWVHHDEECEVCPRPWTHSGVAAPEAFAQPAQHPTDHCVGCDGHCQWWCHYFHGGMAGPHDGSHGITCAVCVPPRPLA